MSETLHMQGFLGGGWEAAPFVPFREGVEIARLHDGPPSVALLRYAPGAGVPARRLRRPYPVDPSRRIPARRTRGKMTRTDLEALSFDIAALHAAYAAGLSPAEVIAESYRRIAVAADPAIFITQRAEKDALAEANRLPPFDPAAYPLWGIPFAVKDNIDVAGLPTTAACPAYAYLPKTDAFTGQGQHRRGRPADDGRLPRLCLPPED